MGGHSLQIHRSFSKAVHRRAARAEVAPSSLIEGRPHAWGPPVESPPGPDLRVCHERRENLCESVGRALGRLAGLGPSEQLPVAIGTTSALVVDRLLAARHPVVPIHPNAFNAARPRWGASRAKSDPGDSYKLADYLPITDEISVELSVARRAEREFAGPSGAIVRPSPTVTDGDRR